jgi:hypothetical protein
MLNTIERMKVLCIRISAMLIITAGALGIVSGLHSGDTTKKLAGVSTSGIGLILLNMRLD